MLVSMSMVVQSSLLELAEEMALGDLGGVTRRTLSHGAWVDVLPGWLSGAECCASPGPGR